MTRDNGYMSCLPERGPPAIVGAPVGTPPPAIVACWRRLLLIEAVSPASSECALPRTRGADAAAAAAATVR